MLTHPQPTWAPLADMPTQPQAWTSWLQQQGCQRGRPHPCQPPCQQQGAIQHCSLSANKASKANSGVGLHGDGRGDLLLRPTTKLQPSPSPCSTAGHRHFSLDGAVLPMAAVMVMRFPDKAPELFAYQASIIRAERNYEGKRWVIYDQQDRREALAKSIARCKVCFSDSHTASTCNPPPGPVGYSGQAACLIALPTSSQPSAGDGRGCCKFPACKYMHECLGFAGTRIGTRLPEETPRCQDARNRSPGTRHSTATAQVPRGARQ